MSSLVLIAGNYSVTHRDSPYTCELVSKMPEEVLYVLWRKNDAIGFFTNRKDAVKCAEAMSNHPPERVPDNPRLDPG